MTTAGERNGVSAPTTLDLFPYSNPRREELTQSSIDFRGFRGEFLSLRGSFQRLNEVSKDRHGRLVRASADITHEINGLRSSRTVSTAFLKMSAELEARGYAEEQIMEVFLRCLDANTDLTGNNIKPYARMDPSKQLLVAQAGGKLSSGLHKVFARHLKSTPSVFGGDIPKWGAFLNEHIFLQYLNLEDGILTRDFSWSQMSQLMGYTDKNSYPDWLVEGEGIFPDKDAVKVELEEDTQAERIAYAKIENIKRQLAAMLGTLEQKYIPAAVRVEAGRRNNWKQVASFPELLLYLEATADMYGYTLSPEEMLRMSRPNYKRYSLSPQKVFDQTIARFFQSEMVFSSPELMALFFERKLRESRLIGSAQDELSEKPAEFLTLLLQPGDSIMQSLEGLDKRAVSVARYDLQPLVGLLEDSDKVYLQEVIAGSMGAKVEGVIQDMADLVASSYNAGSRDRYSDFTKKALEKFRQYACSWTKTNWRWGVRKLHDVLDSKVIEKRLIEASDETSTLVPTSKVQEGIEKSTQEAEEGNLSEWRLFYTTTMRLDDESLVEIGGPTIIERERFLEQLFRRGSIACSIGADSVVAALEWLTTVPEEVEWMRMRKRVGDVDFKKLKRGPVRILYQMDPDSKQMIFFVHQKKAWSYGF